MGWMLTEQVTETHCPVPVESEICFLVLFQAMMSQFGGGTALQVSPLSLSQLPKVAKLQEEDRGALGVPALQRAEGRACTKDSPGRNLHSLFGCLWCLTEGMVSFQSHTKLQN